MVSQKSPKETPVTKATKNALVIGATVSLRSRLYWADNWRIPDRAGTHS